MHFSRQECGEFCAQASDVLAVHQRLNNNAIYDDPATTDTASTGSDSSPASGDPSLGGGDPDTAAYQRYLASSHLVDGPAVLRALRRLQRSAAEGEDASPGWRRPTVVHGRPGSLLERSVAALLTGEEPVAVRRVAGNEAEASGAEGKFGLEAGENEGEVEGTDLEKETGECRENESGEGEKPETSEGQEKAAGTGQEEPEGEEREPAPGGGLELVSTVWHCVDVKPDGGAADTQSPTDAHIRNMFSEYRTTEQPLSL